MLEKTNITQTTLRILALYNDNYKKTLHLREIARKTKTDVNTTYPQLNKLEEMNILTSEIKGKNKEYAMNLDNIIAKYYLTMAEIFTAIRYLQKNFVIKKVMTELDSQIDGPIVLFGSFVKGGYTKESDIDLFVMGQRRINKTVLEIGELVGHDINIKFADPSKFPSGLKDKDPLINEVVSNHIVLKGADKFCDILWRYYESK
ncbi:MAG TPA: nucleotidyltransferase domain-containing protein [Candidatus Nitrosotalea sp.]|nr:nucleotidyltransferase domain-containing protein [Candidatus Nitrosotalea sp.]